MVHLPTASFGLLLLLIGSTTAGPQNDPPHRAVRSSACQEHGALHDRLDIVEKRVDDTVEKLETELATLLDIIEAPEWRPLVDTNGPTLDILEGPNI